MNKIVKIFALTVILLFLLSIYGWMVFHISKGDRSYGFLDKPIKSMYSFLDLFSQSVEEIKTLSVEEVKTLPKTFVSTPKNFESINKLDFDVNVLSTYSDTNDTRTIVIRNLRNDSILYKWNVKNPYDEHDRILNPLLFSDKSIAYAFEVKSGLYKIDSLGNLIWRQDSITVNHSLNFDSDGNIWVCAFTPGWHTTGEYILDGEKVSYIDNYFTKIDASTGRILFNKSITEIFTENNISSYLLKSGHIYDPIHINDVEPVLKTTSYFKEGDVFISLRQPSLVILYRPSTNKVVKLIEGPFVSQHDVDIYDNKSITVFNNNYYPYTGNDVFKPAVDSVNLKFGGDLYSDIVRYGFDNEMFSSIGDSVFRANNISTYSEGLVDFINPTTYFVEEQNTGLLWIIQNDKVIYKNVFKSQYKGYHHLPNWTRIVSSE